jgi:viroplasmin and RNaseH domain-containing protein
VGREGPKIYESWDETRMNTQGVSGTSHKSFPTRKEAEAWQQDQIAAARRRVATKK